MKKLTPVASLYLCLLLCLLSRYAKAQQPLPPISFSFTVPQQVSACGREEEFEFTVTNNSKTAAENVNISIILANGLRYVDNSITVIEPASATLTVSDSSGKLTITGINIISAESYVKFTLKLQAGCEVTGESLLSNQIVVHADLGSGLTSYSATSPTFNTQHAVLNITSISPYALTINLNTPYQRTVTVINGGLGSIREAVLQINTCMQILSAKVGNTSLPVNGNQITLLADYINGPQNNHNGLWDTDESMTLTVELISNSCNCTQESYKVFWGCNQVVCRESDVRPAEVYYGLIQPNVRVSLLRGAYPTFCTPSEDVVITIENNFHGNGVGVPLKDLNIQFGWGDWSHRSPFIVIEDFRLEDTPFTPIIGAINEGYRVPEDVLATVLQDLDGDGKRNDLPPGASIRFKMKVRYNRCNVTGCSPPDFYGFLIGSVAGTYDNCNTKVPIRITNPAWESQSETVFWLVYRSHFVHNSPIDWITPGEPQTVTLCFQHELRNFRCPTDAIVLMVRKADGYTLSTEGGNPFIPKNVIIDATSDPDWYLLRLDPAKGFTQDGNPHTNQNLRLCFSFNITLQDCQYTHQSVCPVPALNPSAPPVSYRFRYTCDNACTCNDYYQCGELINQYTKTKCPAKPSETVGACNYRFEDFTVVRTSLGWTDSTQTARITPEKYKHNLKQAMSCDTVRMHFKIVAGNNPATFNSFKIRIFYYSLSMLYEYAGNPVLKIKDVSANQTHTCSNVAPPQVIPPPWNYFIFELAPAINGCNVNLEQGDILELEADFVVRETQNCSLIDTEFFATLLIDDVSCSCMGDYFKIHEPGYSLNISLRNANLGEVDSITYCGPQYIDVNLLSYCPHVIYPNEFRNFSMPESVTVTLPPGYEVIPPSQISHVFQVGNFYYSNVVKWQYTIPSSDITVNGNTITYNTIGFPLAEQQWGQRIRIPIRASHCRDTTQSIPVEWTSKDFNQSNRCRRTVIRNINGSIRTFFANHWFEELPHEIEYRQKQQRVSFCVHTNRWFAPEYLFSWFTLQHPNLTVHKVEKATGWETYEEVPFIDLGEGKYWVQMGTLAANTCTWYRVTFSWQTCENGTINLRTGWSCAGYPESPFETDCKVATRTLPIRMTNTVLQNQVTAIGEPVGICDTLEYEVLLVNAARGYITHPKVKITLPAAGMSYVPGSAKMQYPVRDNEPFEPIEDPINGEWDLHDLRTVFVRGMPGIVFPDSNKIKLRFKLKLDCNLVIGESVARIESSATRACNAEVQAPPISTLPPQIQDAALPPGGIPYRTSIQWRSENVAVHSECLGEKLFCFRIVNRGVRSTGNRDYVIINLPQPFAYRGGYVSLHNALAESALNAEITTTSNGTRLRFQLPPNVQPNDSIVFGFRTAVQSEVPSACALHSVSVRTMAERQLFCSATQDFCEGVRIQTGSANLPIEILKPTINATFSRIEWVYSESGDRLLGIRVYGNITNTGQIGMHASGSTGLTVNFYCDGEPFGERDPNDRLIGRFQTAHNLLPGETLPVNGRWLQLEPNLSCPVNQVVIWEIKQHDNLNTSRQQCLCNSLQDMLEQDYLLPLSWISVSGKALETGNLIEWTVVESPAPDRYEVQKMIPDEEWGAIGQVAALQNKGGQVITYGFTDNFPGSIEYYRIKAVESNGESSFSKIIGISRDEGKEAFSVFPNPAKSHVVVVGEEDAQMILYDVSGRQIFTARLEAHKRQTVDVSQLSEGVYLIHFTTPTGVKKAKFVKQNH